MKNKEVNVDVDSIVVLFSAFDVTSVTMLEVDIARDMSFTDDESRPRMTTIMVANYRTTGKGFTGS
jgi:hypothetical protein